MKLENAVKKLTGLGFNVVENEFVKNRYTARKEGYRDYIQFYVQNGELIIVDSRREGENDDSMTDYHAGIYCDNLSQAIRMVQK